MTAPEKSRPEQGGGASNNRRGKVNHAGGESSTALQGFCFKWLPLPLALAMAEILPKTNADAGAYVKKCLIALATRKHGECTLSDSMLADAEIYSQTKREAANKRWHGNAGALQVQCTSNAKQTYRQTNKQTEKHYRRAPSASNEYPPNANPRIE